MAKKVEKTENKSETKAKETGFVAGKATIYPAAKTSDTATPPPKDSPPTNKPETKAPAQTKKRYVFPRQGDIKCPGCGLYETVATSSPRGPIQWRRCTRAIPVCGRTFKVNGTEIKVTDCKQDT